MTVPDLDPGQWEAIGTWFSALVALVAAAIALPFSVIQVRRARADAVEQARPDVVAYLDLTIYAGVWVGELVVRNFGRTSALDVRMVPDRALRRSPASGPGGQVQNLAIPEVIRELAPGQEWRVFWDAGTGRVEAGLEMVHELTVKYTGVVLRGREVTTTAVLDWRPYISATGLERGTLRDVAAQLEAIARTVASWGENPRSRGGLGDAQCASDAG